MYKLVNNNMPIQNFLNLLSSHSYDIRIIVLIIITLFIIYKLIKIPDVKIGLLEISKND